VCTLAHVFERLGFATIAFASVPEQARRIAAPRTFYCDFPLGRPLGKPRDVQFQREVLFASFATLQATSGPIWAEFGEVVSDASDESEALSCPLPPRIDPDELAAIDEARALKGAYDRTVEANGARTNFGRVLNDDSLVVALRALNDIAHNGVAWDAAGLPSDPVQTTIDIRAYYIEAALSLSDSVTSPANEAWGLERWFYETTEAGKLLLAARAAMKAAGVAQPIWFYMSSLDQ
jgi:hypothetical protein